MNLSASDVSLAISDPFGLWHNHHGDQNLKNPTDEYDIFLKEQGLRFEQELLKKRHASFIDLKDKDFASASKQTAELLKSHGLTIYSGALQSETLGLRARPDVIKVEREMCAIEEYKLACTSKAAHEIQALFYVYVLKKEYGLKSECKIVSRINEEFAISYDESRIEEAIRLAQAIVSQNKPPHPIYGCPSEWSTLQNKVAKHQADITLAWNVGPVLARQL